MKRGALVIAITLYLSLGIILTMAGASINMPIGGGYRGMAGTMSVSATGPEDSKLGFEPNTGVGYRDNTVYKKGAGLEMNFAAGSGDGEGQGSYGFQPNSTYRFKNLFKVVNKTKDTIKLWITVHGFFDDFDWVKVYSDNNWSKELDPWENPIYLEGNESFWMSVDFENIPSNTPLGQYPGSIVFHTEEPPTPPEKPENPDPVPPEKPDPGDLPDTGGPGAAIIIPAGIGAGLVAMGMGIRHRRKRR